jgi:hypothetical protein
MRVIGFCYMPGAQLADLLSEANPDKRLFYVPPPPPKITKSSVLRKGRKVTHLDDLPSHPPTPPEEPVDIVVLSDSDQVKKNQSYFHRLQPKLVVLVDNPLRMTQYRIPAADCSMSPQGSCLKTNVWSRKFDVLCELGIESDWDNMVLDPVRFDEELDVDALVTLIPGRHYPEREKRYIQLAKLVTRGRGRLAPLLLTQLKAGLPPERLREFLLLLHGYYSQASTNALAIQLGIMGYRLDMAAVQEYQASEACQRAQHYLYMKFEMEAGDGAAPITSKLHSDDLRLIDFGLPKLKKGERMLQVPHNVTLAGTNDHEPFAL